MTEFQLSLVSLYLGIFMVYKLMTLFRMKYKYLISIVLAKSDSLYQSMISDALRSLHINVSMCFHQWINLFICTDPLSWNHLPNRSKLVCNGTLSATRLFTKREKKRKRWELAWWESIQMMMKVEYKNGICVYEVLHLLL
jgi:hypothetical protein